MESLKRNSCPSIGFTGVRLFTSHCNGATITIIVIIMISKIQLTATSMIEFNCLLKDSNLSLLVSRADRLACCWCCWLCYGPHRHNRWFLDGYHNHNHSHEPAFMWNQRLLPAGILRNNLSVCDRVVVRFSLDNRRELKFCDFTWLDLRTSTYGRVLWKLNLAKSNPVERVKPIFTLNDTPPAPTINEWPNALKVSLQTLN